MSTCGDGKGECINWGMRGGGGGHLLCVEWGLPDGSVASTGGGVRGAC